jgi:soluble lytic murein transglycosylase-like protein
MRTACIRVALAVISATAALPAQTSADARAAMEAATVKQRAASASMEGSLALQRSSLEKQTGRAEPGTFFVLAPPAGLGANVAAPAPDTADCESLPSSEVDSLVEHAAKRQDLDEKTLRAVIQRESAFRPCAISPKGAMGLMQLMPGTASQFGVPNPFDPAGNVEAGAAFLKQLLVRYGGDWTLALGAYNAGPARVDAAAGVPDIPETQDYVRKVLSALPVKP